MPNALFSIQIVLKIVKYISIFLTKTIVKSTQAYINSPELQITLGIQVHGYKAQYPFSSVLLYAAYEEYLRVCFH
jgi:C4-type Zn-finger protein